MVNSGLCFVDRPSFLKLLFISNTLLNPPTNNLLRCNSGAILKYKSLLNALCFVIDGRATAPPGNVCIIGVSTSIYSPAFIELLMLSIIFDLLINKCFVWLLLIKSKYLCLYLVSTSFKP